MRSKQKSGVTQLMIHPDTGRVVAKPTSDNEKLTPVNEDWPLEPVDERTLVWELQRGEGDDQMQIETYPTAMSALRCNSCSRFLGTKEDRIISAYYTIKYMSKDPVKVKHMLPVFSAHAKTPVNRRPRIKGRNVTQ